jgi:hypothetical protein
LPYDSGQQKQTVPGQFTYEITFNFIIPKMLLPFDPTLNEQLLHLPPSLG